MRAAAIEHMTPADLSFSLPARFEQAPSQRAIFMTLLFLVPTAVALLLPFWHLAIGLATEAAVRNAALEHPATLAPIGLALVFWIALLGFPILRMLDTLTRSRTVEIAGRTVAVTDRVFGRAKTWRGTLGSFDGIAHNVRTSLGGVRHELILVHPERERSVLIAIAPRLTEAEINLATVVLGLPRMPAAALLGRTARRVVSKGLPGRPNATAATL
ncbi:MAG: hypothetical protein NW216_14970 [Hyphomicrobium sp.]|nr:hypothetical protein [Hyphomicrobium sp.]